MSKVCRYVINKLPAKPHGHRRTGSGIDTGIGIDIDKSKSKSRSQKPYVKREITFYF